MLLLYYKADLAETGMESKLVVTNKFFVCFCRSLSLFDVNIEAVARFHYFSFYFRGISGKLVSSRSCANCVRRNTETDRTGPRLGT